MKIICDLDGTVADNSHREGYIQSTTKDWDSFYRPELILMDKPIEKAVSILRRIIYQDFAEVIYLTGRPESTREATEYWLCAQAIGRPVFMRPNGKHTPAVKFKEEAIRDKIGYFPAVLFIDDDPRNEAMYWKYGIPLHAPDCWDSFMIGKVDTWGKK